MLIITWQATEVLKAVLEHARTRPHECLRLTAIPDRRVGLSLDRERPGDQVVRHGEEKVLVVDSQSADQLEGVKLKYRANKHYTGFTLLRKGEKPA